MNARHYTAQYGQDKFIDDLYMASSTYRDPGIFVEIGAYNGVTLSNTYFLEKIRDWTGLLIEPIPKMAKEADLNRWCDVFDGCVYNKNGTVDLLHIDGYSEMLSGIVEAYHPSHKARIDNEIEQHKQKTEVLQVPCRTLSSLAEEYDLKHIDYLSIDAQTSELAILQSYDGIMPSCKCISIDTNGYNVEEIKKWFSDHNYIQIFKHPNLDEYIYLNAQLSWSWN